MIGGIYRLGNICVGGGTPEQLLTLTASDQPVLRFERDGGTNRWDFEIYARSGGNLAFRGGNNATGTGLNDYMQIKGNGKVSIGGNLNAPSNVGGINIDHFRLFVAGGILTEEVIVRTSWADYVFADDYRLTPLKEVKAHIADKGYLHNTPSAETIENQGLNLGDITVNQQEKIEELFLHVIANAEKVEKLQEEIINLKSQLAASQK